MAEFQRLLATGTCSPFAEVEVPNEARLEPRDTEDTRCRRALVRAHRFALAR